MCQLRGANCEMYTTEQRRKAIDVFVANNCSYVATISELGYPTRQALRGWWLEFLSTGEVPPGEHLRKPACPEDARREAVGRCLDNGGNLSATVRELGYPKSRKTLAVWVDEIAPGERKSISK